MDTGYLDHHKYMKMLGVYVREQRERLQLSPSALARQVKIPVNRLKLIEEGQVALREATFEKLKNQLSLDEGHLEKILEVAKVAFIDQLCREISETTVKNTPRILEENA